LSFDNFLSNRSQFIGEFSIVDFVGDLIFEIADSFAGGGAEVTGEFSEIAPSNQKQQGQANNGASGDFHGLFHRLVPFRTEGKTQTKTIERPRCCVDYVRLTIGPEISGGKFRNHFERSQKQAITSKTRREFGLGGLMAKRR
jgi:hypothetical protein